MRIMLKVAAVVYLLAAIGHGGYTLWHMDGGGSGGGVQAVSMGYVPIVPPSDPNGPPPPVVTAPVAPKQPAPPPAVPMFIASQERWEVVGFTGTTAFLLLVLGGGMVWFKPTNPGWEAKLVHKAGGLVIALSAGWPAWAAWQVAAMADTPSTPMLLVVQGGAAWAVTLLYLAFKG